MGCVCVSILVAFWKERVGTSCVDEDSAVMEDKASWWKGRVVKSMESRRAFAWMRDMRV